MTEQRTSASGERGFTLVEMLIALAILALGAALVVPMATRTRDDLALLAAARELAMVLRSVQAAAIESGRERTLVIEPASRRYWADGIAAPRTVDASLAVGPGDTDPSDGGRRVLRMGPDGSSNGARVLLQARGRGVRVAVEPMTGRVSVEAR